jgi:hypothetical protein
MGISIGLTLFREHVVNEILKQNEDISRHEAERAVNRCILSVSLSGAIMGLTSAAALLFVFSNPAGWAVAGVGTAVGPVGWAAAGVGTAVGYASGISTLAGTHPLFKAESCAKIREAVFNWNNGIYNRSTISSE